MPTNSIAPIRISRSGLKKSDSKKNMKNKIRPHFFLLTALVLCFCTSDVKAAETLPRIKVLIVDGYSNHDWQRTTRLARGILGGTGLFDIAVSTAPARTNDPAYSTWNPTFRDFDVVIQTCNDLEGRGPLWPLPAREG